MVLFDVFCLGGSKVFHPFLDPVEGANFMTFFSIHEETGNFSVYICSSTGVG